MIRLNTDIAPPPLGQRARLGLLAGQLDGFPNGRRLEDDVVDIELRALAGATPLATCNGVSPNQNLGDGVDAPTCPSSTTSPTCRRRTRATTTPTTTRTAERTGAL